MIRLIEDDQFYDPNKVEYLLSKNKISYFRYFSEKFDKNIYLIIDDSTGISCRISFTIFDCKTREQINDVKIMN